METVEAEWHGWSPAPYADKAQTDANFCRMLDFACDPRRARAVNLAVGSHNLFDIALILALREARGLGPLVELEMLEGMANHQARAVRQAASGLVLYAPVVHRENFSSALTYLLRRLDENTAPENFLRDSFGLAPESESWNRQRDRFVLSWQIRADAATESRRASPLSRPSDHFQNAPDTDWTQPEHRQALADALARGPAQVPAAGLSGQLNDALEALTAAQPAMGEERPRTPRRLAPPLRRRLWNRAASIPSPAWSSRAKRRLGRPTQKFPRRLILRATTPASVPRHNCA